MRRRVAALHGGRHALQGIDEPGAVVVEQERFEIEREDAASEREAFVLREHLRGNVGSAHGARRALDDFGSQAAFRDHVLEGRVARPPAALSSG